MDEKIIETSLADAADLRKKHQYASAIKAYKTLLTDYTNTPHEAPIKVLLDAAIVEDYNYRAKRALGKHDYKTARSALRKIIELYPETAYAEAAEKAILSAISVAVKYYQKQGDAHFHSEEIGVPQKKAALF